jgi:hypothetical protein
MTSKEMTRKQFLTLGAGAAAVVLIPGCGDDGSTDTGADSESGGSSTNSTTNSTTVTTSDTTTMSTTVTTTDASSSSSGDESASTGATATESGSESSTGADSGSESSSTGSAGECDHDPDVEIGTNHLGAEHVMVVTLEEVMAGVQLDYDIRGASLHTHTVTLSAADYATLAGGGQVMVDSSFGTHMHTVTVICQ